jgi:hypothetical protein
MGLLRGMARTAVVAGTATAVSNRVSRRQAQRWGAQDAQQYGGDPYGGDPYGGDPYAQRDAYAAPAPEPSASLDEQLERLGRLHRDGVLSDEEFAAAKRSLLTG